MKLAIPILCYLLLQACTTSEPLAVYWCTQRCEFGGGAGSTYQCYVAAESHDDAVDQVTALGEWRSPARCSATCGEAK